MLGTAELLLCDFALTFCWGRGKIGNGMFIPGILGRNVSLKRVSRLGYKKPKDHMRITLNACQHSVHFHPLKIDAKCATDRKTVCNHLADLFSSTYSSATVDSSDVSHAVQTTFYLFLSLLTAL